MTGRSPVLIEKRAYSLHPSDSLRGEVLGEGGMDRYLEFARASSCWCDTSEDHRTVVAVWVTSRGLFWMSKKEKAQVHSGTAPYLPHIGPIVPPL
jgi:hypothetical protein